MLMRGYIHHTGFQTEYIECSCLRASAFWDAKGCFGTGKFGEAASVTSVEILKTQLRRRWNRKYPSAIPVTRARIWVVTRQFGARSPYAGVAEVDSPKRMRRGGARDLFVFFSVVGKSR